MQKLKDLREEKGITVENLAKAIGINVRTIFRWEAGESEITSNNLISLANFFGCTTDELLGRENYATGNIEIIGEKLNNDEKDILAVYRVLNDDGKRAFLSMVKNLATLNNVAVKIS